MNLAGWAVRYAERGWPVFPLRGKRPHPMLGPSGGFHHATTDVAAVAQWWDRDGTANIGLACGVAFDVLDIDHVDYVEGVADLPDAMTDGGPVAVTGRGRWHLYFLPTGLGRRIRFARHCDWLGSGGYTVAPPSVHPDTGQAYRWFAPFDLALYPPPVELLEVLDPRVRQSTPTRGAHEHSERVLEGRASGGWSPNGVLDRMRRSVEGERNDALFWCAAVIFGDIADGRAPADAGGDALVALADIARTRGLGDREIERTIASAGK